ncbi:wd g-beta repeat-containing protein [Cystoisospora suis]|uniref:Wd g-beta repeat-containing protein n=1 Tax=Cystoisospora suis TaxID=483139 RepID=A0A2C6L0X3_9APIC|nr:wd g-beta repeat-containing protein [Cystoisospora suis]
MCFWLSCGGFPPLRPPSFHSSVPLLWVAYLAARLTMSEPGSFSPPFASLSDAHSGPSYISAEAVDADVLLPPGPVGHEGDGDDTSLLSEEDEDFDLPAAPPGCRWVIEAPDGTFVDPAVAVPSPSANSSEARELIGEAEKRLRLTFSGSTDSICCSSVFLAREKFGGSCLVALGSCDDVCRLYLFSPFQLRVPPQQHSASDPPFSPLVQGSQHEPVRDEGSSIRGPAAREKRTDLGRIARCPASPSAAVSIEPSSVLSEGKDTISSVTFSFDGSLVACGCFDGDVRVYRVSSTPHTASHCGGDSLSSHVGASAAPSSPPSASATKEAGEHISVLAPQIRFSTSLVETLKGPSADVTDAVFHPRGYALLAASADRTAWVWLIPASLARQKPEDMSDGSRGKPDGTARKNTLPTAQALSVFVGAAPLTSCAYSGDGKLCLVGGEDGTLSAFNPKNGEAVFSLQHPLREPAALHPTVRAHVPLRNLAAEQNEDEEGAGPSGIVCLRVFSVGGSTGEERIISVGYENGWILVLHENGGKVLVSAAAHSGHSVEAIELIGRTRSGTSEGSESADVDAQNRHWLVTGGLDGYVLVWDIARRTVKHSISVNSLPSRRNQASRRRSVQKASVELRDTRVGVKESEADDRSDPSVEEDMSAYEEAGVTKILAHPGGLPVFCVGTTDGRVILLDVRTGDDLCVWAAHEGAVMEIQDIFTEVGEASKNGAQQDLWGVVTAGDDGAGRAWAIQPLAELAKNVQQLTAG